MDYLTIGVIGKAHGIKGDVIVHPMTYDMNRFYDLDRVFIDEGLQQLHIEYVKEFKNSFRIKFKESIDRNFAESIRNKEVQIPESEKIDLPDDVYFIHELVGCRVFDSKQEEIGQIKSVQESPSYDIYVVHDGVKEIMIPAISKFVKEIDIENKKIQIEEIPGLLNL